MKKLITTCVLLAAVSMVSFAQSKQAATKTTKATNKTVAANTPTAEQSAGRLSKMYQQQYGLNDQQYKGVYEAELSYNQQLEQIRATGVEPGQGQLMQAGMMRDQKIKNAMTPEQYSKYETAQQTQKKNN